jgi:hypothetical protein
VEDDRLLELHDAVVVLDCQRVTFDVSERR